MVILTTVLRCKSTVGQFTTTFAHSYTSNWQLGHLESSGEETILHEKYAVCLHIKQMATYRATEFRLLAKHRVCVSQGWGTEGLHPTLRSQVVICFLRNTVIDSLEKKYDHLGPIALKGRPGPHCPL